ncbi:MAG: DUF2231 domain-containing protein [Desulfuromonadales bacterium]|jgi:uncharacterized membrane protein
MAEEHPGIRSTASIAGHPIHPMGIPFPITFLCVLPFADAAYGFTGDVFWARVSWWLAGLGFITAAIAAMVGLVDFTTIRRVREHVAGWIHASSNALALFFAFWNIFLRWERPSEAVFPWGILLSVLVAVLVAVAGWYGGELAYRHKIGVTGH